MPRIHGSHLYRRGGATLVLSQRRRQQSQHEPLKGTTTPGKTVNVVDEALPEPRKGETQHPLEVVSSWVPPSQTPPPPPPPADTTTTCVSPGSSDGEDNVEEEEDSKTRSLPQDAIHAAFLSDRKRRKRRRRQSLKEDSLVSRLAPLGDVSFDDIKAAATTSRRRRPKRQRRKDGSTVGRLVQELECEDALWPCRSNFVFLPPLCDTELSSRRSTTPQPPTPQGVVVQNVEWGIPPCPLEAMPLAATTTAAECNPPTRVAVAARDTPLPRAETTVSASTGDKEPHSEPTHVADETATTTFTPYSEACMSASRHKDNNNNDDDDDETVFETTNEAEATTHQQPEEPIAEKATAAAAAVKSVNLAHETDKDDNDTRPESTSEKERVDQEEVPADKAAAAPARTLQQKDVPPPQQQDAWFHCYFEARLIQEDNPMVSEFVEAARLRLFWKRRQRALQACLVGQETQAQRRRRRPRCSPRRKPLLRYPPPAFALVNGDQRP